MAKDLQTLKQTLLAELRAPLIKEAALGELAFAGIGGGLTGLGMGLNAYRKAKTRSTGHTGYETDAAQDRLEREMLGKTPKNEQSTYNRSTKSVADWAKDHPGLYSLLVGLGGAAVGTGATLGLSKLQARYAAKLASFSVPESTAKVPLEPPKKKRAKFPFQGFIRFQGLDIDIENKRGSTRRGKCKDGTPWATYMHHHYGEIRGTEGLDGDKLDCYVGPNLDSPLVVIVHQQDPDTKKLDEDKAMLGFDTEREAIAAYKRQYDRPGYYRSHVTWPIGRFVRWCCEKKHHGEKVASAQPKNHIPKPFAFTPDYTMVARADMKFFGVRKGESFTVGRYFPDQGIPIRLPNGKYAIMRSQDSHNEKMASAKAEAVQSLRSALKDAGMSSPRLTTNLPKPIPAKAVAMPGKNLPPPSAAAPKTPKGEAL